jgi:hypothetical protein
MPYTTRVFVLLCGLLFVPASAQAAEDSIVVSAASGRHFRGQVDPRTNDLTLWLRSGKPRAFVQRPINWNRVVSVNVAGKRHTANEFRQLARTMILPQFDLGSDNAPAASQRIPSVDGILEAENATKLATFNATDHPRAEPPRVVSLHIDTDVANWDSDVEVDGLVVHVYPLDSAGATIPALGTFEVDLIGQAASNGVSGSPFPVLGHWSCVIRPEEMGPNGVVLRFPFQRSSPEFNQKWSVASVGMVHARLSVAGNGVFDDTASFTRIRHYSPVRDRMQQQQGRRFHPLERTSQRSG